MGHSPSHVANEATDIISQEGGLVPFVRNAVFGGIVWAFNLEVITGIQSVGALLVDPIRVLGEMTVAVIRALFRNLISVFDAGTQTAVLSFTDGITRFLGPFAQPYSVGIVMLTLIVFFYGINYISWSPWAFITSIRESN